ncbi:MAG: hypothetical protein WCR04_10545, partial [Fibrobacteraceae bacterium]
MKSLLAFFSMIFYLCEYAHKRVYLRHGNREGSRRTRIPLVPKPSGGGANAVTPSVRNDDVIQHGNVQYGSGFDQHPCNLYVIV